MGRAVRYGSWSDAAKRKIPRGGVSIGHLLLKGARDFLKDQNTYLEGEVERRMRARQG